MNICILRETDVFNTEVLRIFNLMKKVTNPWSERQKTTISLIIPLKDMILKKMRLYEESLKLVKTDAYMKTPKRSCKEFFSSKLIGYGLRGICITPYVIYNHDLQTCWTSRCYWQTYLSVDRINEVSTGISLWPTGVLAIHLAVDKINKVSNGISPWPAGVVEHSGYFDRYIRPRRKSTEWLLEYMQ